MSSLISGFEYDIFVSYRQKDNKYDGWVTEFVSNLKKELEATLKDDISVYFDINPHDGLLETHDVNASLKEKLKCLILIPIISQTYCDPKSFAWEHEFKVFIDQATSDQFGLKIKLPNGNVACRVLPIRIHDLDDDDMKICESVLGGLIRGIEFIYKEPGVNKPLGPEDEERKNLNKTKYRIQINKTANAIKEIILGLKGGQTLRVQVSSEDLHQNDLRENNTKTDARNCKINSHDDSSKTLIRTKKKFILYLSGLLLGIFLIATAVFYSISIGNEKPGKVKEELEKTIGVLPFENLLNNQEYLWLGDALTDEIIMQLINIEGFKVRPKSSVLKYKGTTKTHEEVGRELRVNYIIDGTVFRFNDSVKINIDLINAFTDTQQWSESFEGEWKDLLPMQRKIAKALAYKLKAVLSVEEISRIDKKMTDEPEAFKYYAQGNDLMMGSVEPKEFTKAMNLFEKAIEMDPEFCMAHMKLGMCYLQLYWFGGRNAEMLKKCKESIDDAFRIDPDIPNMPEAHFSLAQYYYYGFLNYDKALEEVGTAEKLSNYNLEYPGIKAAIYRRTGKWELAKENYIKAFEASPNNSSIAFYVAETLYLLGEYPEAENYFKTASLIAPTSASSYWERINMYMKWRGNTIQGRETIIEAFQFDELINDEKLFESNVLMDVYDGYYDKAISYIASKNIGVISTQFSFDLKSLLLARIYNLKNLPDKAHSYFDSARIDIESRIIKTPDDSRLYSALGIAYAGLGQKGNAIASGAKAVELMPYGKDAFFAAYREEDLARILVMVGEYDQALDKIKLLLSRPGPLSVKLLLLDPTWKPLWEMPEFRKIVRKAPSDNSRI